MTYKQYKFTSANFVSPGETGDTDAYMDPAELQELRKLAGLLVSEDMGSNGAGPVGGNLDAVPHAQENGIVSPIGSSKNISTQERKQLEREYHIMPGTDLWFMINFAKPELSIETVRSQVERYLKAHPEYRPKQAPQ